MKIGEYEQMMSYLTRPAFENGTPLPKKKPYTLENFKRKADLYMQAMLGSSNKEYFRDLIVAEYDKAKAAGVDTEAGLEFIKEKRKMYDTLMEEGRMQGEPAQLGPSYGVERENFYKGSSLESELDKIKKLFLEGKTDREIAEIIKQPRSTIEKAIRSMKDGSAPVKISAKELNNRPAPAGSNLAKSQEVTNRINETYKELTQKLGKPPTRAQLAEAANVSPGTIRTNAPNLKFTSAADEGAKATAEMYKKQKVDKPTRTTYEGVKGAKFKNAAQEAEYKKFLELAAEYPKGSPKNPYDKKFFAEKFNMPETDVESIHKIVREKYNINYPKAKDTSAGIRAEQLRTVSDTGLEQEYTKLKKGEKIGNPDLAHRVSKKYNVTTSNLGLDHPLINRVIVKPNERDISRLYDERIKIINKYKLKDGTFKKASNADIKRLEEINSQVMDLASETKGRLSAIVNDPTDLNKPYGTFGIDHSKTIGGGIIDNVMLKDVRNLPLEDQAFLKLNLLNLKNNELNKTSQSLATEFKDVLSKPKVKERIKNIVDTGKMEKSYIKQAKQILALSDVEGLTTADQLPIPEKTKNRNLFKDFEIRTGGNVLGSNVGLFKGIGETIKAIPTPTGTLALTAGLGVDPTSAIDRVALGAEAAFAPELVKQTSRITSNPIVQRFFNLGLSPQMALRAARIMSPVGVASLAGEGIYQLYKAGKAEKAKLDAMTDEQREGYLREQEAENMVAAASGGLIRKGFADGPDDPGRRQLLKILGGLTTLPFVGKFIKMAEPLAPAVSKAIDGMPEFITDLIKKVKAKAEETGMRYFTGNRSDEFADVYKADGYTVTEQGNKITVTKRNEQGEMLEKDIEMEIETDPETGGVTYREATARPDAEGKLKDVEEYIDEIDLEDMKKYTYDE